MRRLHPGRWLDVRSGDAGRHRTPHHDLQRVGPAQQVRIWRRERCELVIAAAAEFVRLQTRRLVAPAYTSAETIERLIAGLNAAFAPAAQLDPACGSAFLPHPSGDKR